MTSAPTLLETARDSLTSKVVTRSLVRLPTSSLRFQAGRPTPPGSGATSALSPTVRAWFALVPLPALSVLFSTVPESHTPRHGPPRRGDRRIRSQ